jgi:hypothetical protein
MYSVRLGFRTALKRIGALKRNKYNAEALVTSVFTLEKLMRRSLRLAPNPRARARARARRWRRELGGGVRQHPGSNNCVEGGRPVGQGFGRCGAITHHSASVKSVWYRVMGRLCCCRVVGVHMANPRLVREALWNHGGHHDSTIFKTAANTGRGD